MRARRRPRPRPARPDQPRGHRGRPRRQSADQRDERRARQLRAAPRRRLSGSTTRPCSARATASPTTPRPGRARSAATTTTRSRSPERSRTPSSSPGTARCSRAFRSCGVRTSARAACRSIAPPPSTRRRSTTSIAATSTPGTSRSSGACRANVSVDVAYVGAKGVGGYAGLDINAPLTLGGGDASRPYLRVRAASSRSTRGAPGCRPSTSRCRSH